MRHLIAFVAALALFAGCGSTTIEKSSDISPIQAVVAASEHPINGTFVIEVRAAGRQNERLYLNSETDYRDQRCLTIAIPDPVAAELEANSGATQRSS